MSSGKPVTKKLHKVTKAVEIAFGSATVVCVSALVMAYVFSELLHLDTIALIFGMMVFVAYPLFFMCACYYLMQNNFLIKIWSPWKFKEYYV